MYYKCFPDEHVRVSVNGSTVEFRGTIRALGGAPLGACQNLAKTGGVHPYICIACNALMHGKSSPLNRKLIRSKTLKNPRNDDKRGTKVGVSHKYSICMQLSNLEKKWVKIKWPNCTHLMNSFFVIVGIDLTQHVLSLRP